MGATREMYAEDLVKEEQEKTCGVAVLSLLHKRQFVQ